MPKIITYLDEFYDRTGPTDEAIELEATVLATFTDLEGDKWFAFQTEGMPDVNIIAEGSRFFVSVTNPDGSDAS